MEEWKKVPGKRFLEVSTKGRLKRLARVTEEGYRISEKISTPKPTKRDGRIRVAFYEKGGRKGQEELHRMVARTFVPNPGLYNFVHQKDGNLSNNEVSNLEWVESVPGKGELKNKAVVGKDANGVIQKRFKSIAEGKRQGYTGIMASLKQVCKCKGLMWFYAED